ncbi:MAG: ArsR family transcriptional regulator [Flavobacteriales bacterium]|nr:ArsR family transcriptional regulator [Flavobacteriales bacterium]
MLDTIVSSKTKINLLIKFFLNSSNTSYLRNLESEFSESTNAIRIELNKFENAGLLQSHQESNKKIFKANTSHPLFPELNSLVRKYVGIDKIIDSIISKLGMPEKVWLTGKFAQGLNSDTIELLMTGDVDHKYLDELVVKVEKKINKKLKINHLLEKEAQSVLDNESYLLIWSRP